MATYTKVCQGLVGDPCSAILEIVTVADDDPNAGKVSHGYCPNCYQKWMAQIEAAKKCVKVAKHGAA